MLMAVLFLASLSAVEQIFVHQVTEGTMKQTQQLLLYIREEKFAEAIQLAQMLDLSYVAVQQLIWRAKDALRKQLEGGEGK